MGVAPYKRLIHEDWQGLERIINDLYRILNADTTLLDLITPPGSDGEVIYNKDGVYGADSTFTLDDSTKAVTCQVLNITTVAASVVDTDKFLVDDSNEVKFRTGEEVLSDIGGSAVGHLHDGATLQHDGVNSDGGAFAFTTSGAVTFSQDLILSGTETYGIDLSSGTWSSGVMNWDADPNVYANGSRVIRIDDTLNNLFFGTDAGIGVTTDEIENLCIGFEAGRNLVNTAGDEGKRNVFMGYLSGKGTAGADTNKGNSNTGIGYHTLRALTTGNQNVGMGSRALSSCTTGNRNFGLGELSLLDLLEGDDNVAVGRASQANVVDADFNVGIGTNTLFNNVIGSWNVAIGQEVLFTSNSSVGRNIGIGGNALYTIGQGWGNTAIGYSAATSITAASQFNVAIGYEAGKGTANAYSNNTIVGTRAGLSLTTGSDNCFLGYLSGYNQTTNSDLLIIDNQDRGSAAVEITDCLLYGVFNATPASQSLRLNLGNLYLGNPTHSDADGGGAVVQSFIREDGAGTASTSATITGSHDGTGVNDTDGKLVLATNLDGTGLVDAVFIDSSQQVGIGNAPTIPFDMRAKIGMTSIGGLAVKLTNKTGANSIAGYCVTNSDATADAVKLVPIDEPNCIGVFLDSGIADGSEAWVVVAGIAAVYFWGNTTLGHLARTGLTTDTGEVSGQALSEAIPTSPFSVDKHFCEIGHVLESRVGAGLARCILHFN